MSQETNPKTDKDILPEYDFSHGVRGAHHEAYKAGANVVFLEPDLAKVFTDSAQVNSSAAPASTSGHRKRSYE